MIVRYSLLICGLLLLFFAGRASVKGDPMCLLVGFGGPAMMMLGWV